MAISKAHREFNEQLEKGVRSLVRRDSRIRDLKRLHGTPTFRPHGDYFGTLVSSILSQQISGSAAETIKKRVVAVAGGLSDPTVFGSIPDERLRGCGVSGQKVGYIKSLAEHVLDDRLNLKRLPKLPDEEVVAALTDVKGIGVWTAKMFMMFSLGRLDVLAFEDLGVRHGARIAYGLGEMPGRAQLEELAEANRWSPFRSIACWYMWRATEPVEA